jgi:hypothetical protein
LHGCYLTINHGWREFAARIWTDRQRYDRVMIPVGGTLTFVAVVVAMVFFRSPTIATTLDVLRGAIGLNGIALPAGLLDHLGPIAQKLHRVGVVGSAWSVHDFAKAVIWISGLMFVALACPNTLQMLAAYEPALGVKPEPHRRFLASLRWDATLPWAAAVAVIGAVAIGSMGGPSEFLYWQF